MSEADLSPALRKRNASDYLFGARIGEGLYLSVYSAKDVHSGKTFAIKVLLKRHIVKENKIKYVNIEKLTLHRLGQQHPGIVQLYCTFQDDSLLYFVLDFAEYGELLSIVRKFGLLSEPVSKFYMVQLLDSVQFMHSRGIIHRDLKPENILVSLDLNIKITDFGAAKLLPDPINSEDPAVSAGMSGAQSLKKGSFVGTAEYVPPELLKNNACGIESDIWALACILYQFFHGNPPFKAATEYLTFEKIINVDYRYLVTVPRDVAPIIDDILVPDPNQRPSIEQLKSYNWFRDVRWDRSSIWNAKVPRFEPYREQTLQPFVPTLKNGLNRSLNKSNITQQLQKGLYRGDVVVPIMQLRLAAVPPSLPPSSTVPAGLPYSQGSPQMTNLGHGTIPATPGTQMSPKRNPQRNYPQYGGPSPKAQYLKPKMTTPPLIPAPMMGPNYQGQQGNSLGGSSGGPPGGSALNPSPHLTHSIPHSIPHSASYNGTIPRSGSYNGYRSTSPVKTSPSPTKRENVGGGAAAAAAAAAAASKGVQRSQSYSQKFNSNGSSSSKASIPATAAPQSSSRPSPTPQPSSRSSPVVKQVDTYVKYPATNMKSIGLSEISGLLSPNEKILKLDTILKAQLNHLVLKRSSAPLDDTMIDQLIKRHNSRLTLGAVPVITVITNQARVFFVDAKLNVMRIDLKANNGADYLLYDYEFESEDELFVDSNGVLSKGGDGYLILELIREGGDLIFLKRIAKTDRLLESVQVVKKNGDVVRLGPNYGWIDCLLMAKEMVNGKKEKKAPNVEKQDTKSKRMSTASVPGPKSDKPISKFAYAAAAAVHK